MARPNSNISNGTSSDSSRLTDQYTVPEAAQALGISPEAVRNRLSRGTLESTKEDGTVYVLLPTDMVRHNKDSPGDRPGSTLRPTGEILADSSSLMSAKDETIGVLKAQLEAERAAGAELRRIVATLVQRVPEPEVAQEPREGHTTVSEEAYRGAAPPEQQKPSQRRS